MDSGKQREIARKGGMAAHQKGTAHEFTAEEARAAGRKGGERVSANRNHMAEIGRLGGKRSAERRRTEKGSAETSSTQRNEGNNPDNNEPSLVHSEPGQSALTQRGRPAGVGKVWSVGSQSSRKKESGG